MLPTLKSLLDQQRAVLPDETALRLHRAISWFDSALTFDHNPDHRFIALWVCFSACFGRDDRSSSLGERNEFIKFIDQLERNDTEGELAFHLWGSYANSVRSLIDNPYVLRQYWEPNQPDEHWQNELKRQKSRVSRYFKERAVASLLVIVLDRLSVLRDQILNGGATFNSRVNRRQVLDGTDLLTDILPIIMRLMLNHPEENWGKVLYPPQFSTVGNNR